MIKSFLYLWVKYLFTPQAKTIITEHNGVEEFSEYSISYKLERRKEKEKACVIRKEEEVPFVAQYLN